MPKYQSAGGNSIVESSVEITLLSRTVNLKVILNWKGFISGKQVFLWGIFFPENYVDVTQDIGVFFILIVKGQASLWFSRLYKL